MSDVVRDSIYRHLENMVYENIVIVDDHTLQDLGLDSLDAIELIMEIEDDLDTDIEDHEFPIYGTVGEMIEAVNVVWHRR